MATIKEMEAATNATVVANGTENTEEKDADKSTVETEGKTESETQNIKTSEPEIKEKQSNSVDHNDHSDDSVTSSSEDEDETSAEKPNGASKETPSSPSVTPPVITIDGAEPRQEEATAKPEPEDTGKGDLATLAPRMQRRRSSTPFTEKRGFLYKRGGHHKNWKLRYFVLQPGGFMYFKKDPHAKPIREVKLKNMSISYPTESEKQQSYQFHVHTESSWNKRPNWVMAAQSDQDMQAWIAAFKLAGQMGGVSPVNSDVESEGEEANESVPTRMQLTKSGRNTSNSRRYSY